MSLQAFWLQVPLLRLDVLAELLTGWARVDAVVLVLGAAGEPPPHGLR